MASTVQVMRHACRALAAVAISAALAACAGKADQVIRLDDAAFEEAEVQLEQMIERGRAGDTAGAEEAFGQVGGFLHLLNTALASMPEEVVVRAEVLDAAVSMEQELAGERRPDVLADIAEGARRSLAEVAELLVQRQ